MALTILHAEDDKVIADAVKETLEAEGWKVESCADGTGALSRLASGEPFDLLILDNRLPGASGEDIVRYARSLPHRIRTPIIVFSASEYTGLAVDAYLRKPEDVGRIVETVVRLTE